GRSGSQRQLQVFIVLWVAAIGYWFHRLEHQRSSSENVENAAAGRVRDIFMEFRAPQELEDVALDRRGQANGFLRSRQEKRPFGNRIPFERGPDNRARVKDDVRHYRRRVPPRSPRRSARRRAPRS